MLRAEMFPEDNCYFPVDNREVTSSNLKYFACDSKKGDCP